jgi:hypothetical protein
MTFQGALVACNISEREWTDRNSGQVNKETDRVLYLVEDFTEAPRRIAVEDPDVFAQLAHGGQGQVLDLVCDVTAVGTGRGAFNKLTLVRLVGETTPV